MEADGTVLVCQDAEGATFVYLYEEALGSFGIFLLLSLNYFAAVVVVIGSIEKLFCIVGFSFLFLFLLLLLLLLVLGLGLCGGGGGVM